MGPHAVDRLKLRCDDAHPDDMSVLELVKKDSNVGMLYKNNGDDCYRLYSPGLGGAFLLDPDTHDDQPDTFFAATYTHFSRIYTQTAGEEVDVLWSGSCRSFPKSKIRISVSAGERDLWKFQHATKSAKDI